MRAVFIHQNMPGQFGRLASTMARARGNQVAFVTQRTDIDLPGILRVSYSAARAHPTGGDTIEARFGYEIANGRSVVQALRALEGKIGKPDVIIGHPGWGELLFVKDLYPDVPLVSYCEFYHDPTAPFFQGDPPEPLTFAGRMWRRAQSAHLLLSLEAADKGWSPTSWQKSLHPAAFREKIEVVFDGVDARRICPDASATFVLPDGRTLSCGDEVITYAARSLEPTRGFPSFMRALPHILARRPDARVVIAGVSEPHYDAPPQRASTWRDALSSSVELDPERVFFVGRLAREPFVRMLQVSSAHVYLTSPVVLSWSMVEAMSAGCLVVASDSPPVRDILVDGLNGRLTQFNAPEQIAVDVAAALSDQARFEIRRAARRHVEEALSIEVCLPRQRRLIASAANGNAESPTSAR